MLFNFVVGVRSNPQLFHFHIGRGLGNDGSGYDSVILEAVQGCIDNGAKVVSLSLGGPGKTNTAKVIKNICVIDVFLGGRAKK